jgi:type IV pilus assembly protein PilW
MLGMAALAGLAPLGIVIGAPLIGSLIRNPHKGPDGGPLMYTAWNPNSELINYGKPEAEFISESITDPGDPTKSDEFVVNYSISNSVIAPAPFTQNAAAGAPYVVQSPLGFKAGDLIVAISGSGKCDPSKITAVSAPDAATGEVTITHTGAPDPFSTDAFLLNMGSAANAQRIRYDVDPKGVLRSTALWDSTGAAVAQAPNPLASNIVEMKSQYGIDTGTGGLMDTWVPATGAWDAPSVLAAPITTLTKIKAVRIGILVRGEQWDKTLGDYNWSFFDGTVSGTILAAGGNYRYRIYETVVPMRNSIWNFTP